MATGEGLKQIFSRGDYHLIVSERQYIFRKGLPPENDLHFNDEGMVVSVPVEMGLGALQELLKHADYEHEEKETLLEVLMVLIFFAKAAKLAGVRRPSYDVEEGGTLPVNPLIFFEEVT